MRNLEIKYLYFELNKKLLEKGHKLNLIFKELPTELQERIINKMGIQQPMFEDFLNKYSDIFSQWRYKYEYIDITTIDKSFLKYFELALYEEVIEIRGK